MKCNCVFFPLIRWSISFQCLPLLKSIHHQSPLCRFSAPIGTFFWFWSSPEILRRKLRMMHKIRKPEPWALHSNQLSAHYQNFCHLNRISVSISSLEPFPSIEFHAHEFSERCNARRKRWRWKLYLSVRKNFSYETCLIFKISLYGECFCMTHHGSELPRNLISTSPHFSFS